MSLVDDRGKKLGEYEGRTIDLINNVPFVIYHDFKAEGYLKLEDHEGDEKDSKVEFPNITAPISKVGGKIPVDKVSGFIIESVRDIEDGLSLEELDKLEEEIKKLKECVDYSKK